MQYKQLTLDQRYHIFSLKKAGFNYSAIAIEIKVHKSTVSREIKRNSGKHRYYPEIAHEKAFLRRSFLDKRHPFPAKIVALIRGKLCDQWSPEQIAGYLKRHNIAFVSHQWIYTYIKKDRKRGGTLYKNLRQEKKKRRVCASSRKKISIKNRVSIDERPGLVSKKERIGDWEIDTVVGMARTGYLVTLVERRSRLTLIAKVAKKTSKDVVGAAIKLLHPYKNNVFTVTADNGTEFAKHEKLSSELNAKVYFAHPY